MIGDPEARDYFRFCPGEEQIKISNAICRGRRRVHFPKCRGCQFNDDELGRQTPVQDRGASAALVEGVFREDDVCTTTPKPLSEEVAWRIGHAAGQYMLGRLRGYERAQPKARVMIVGRDLRSHSPTLQAALIEGLRSAEMDVVNIGVIDTPQLYFAVTRSAACGGVQTTGGRKPGEFNGFKFCGAGAAPIGTDTGLASIRDLAARVPKHQTGSMGRLTETEFAQPYADFVLSILAGGTRLTGHLTVAADASNGVAGRWLPLIFNRVADLNIVPVNFESDGHGARAPDPLVVENLRELRQRVKEDRADFGVCFDGDASRCVFVDEKGSAVPPDVVAALLARSFLEREPGATVVFDLRSTDALAEEVERAGGVPVRSRVGELATKKTMAERNAVFGSDLAGRCYFRSNAFCESALLALAGVINLLSTTGRKLSELARPIQRYRSSGNLRFECRDPDTQLQSIRAAHPDARIEEFDGVTIRYPDWWLHVRKNAARPGLHLLLEARTKKIVEEKLAELQPLLGKPE